MNEDVIRFLKYLQFKGECAAYQEANPVRFDKELAERCVAELEAQQDEKVKELIKVMPKTPVKVKRNKPKATHKQDGTLNVYGDKWFRLLREHKLPMNHSEPVEVVTDYVDANPNSTDQVKAWLESMGWVPCTYDYKKDNEGEERKIPQVRKNGELAPSVLALVEKNPTVEILDGLTVVQHRLGVFKGFLDSCIVTPTGEYCLQATVAGLTNTLRFKHKKPLVNLPGVDKPWGKEIRSCLLANPDEFMSGADMVSLESTTKRHYLYPHDPEYAEVMSQPGFDEHVDLAVKAGAVTQDDYDYYTSTPTVETDPRWKMIHSVRKTYKPVNYSAVYGIGATKLARETGKSMAEAKALLEAYWERNWAVKKIAEEQYVKELGGYLWLKNPVSGFYYELRYDKDRFSTLNQGTGVYLFDSWLVRARTLGYQGQFQFHDETGSSVTNPKETEELLKKAIEILNKDLTLNVLLDVDVKFGQNYAEVH